MIKNVLRFTKIEHTSFSLPLIFAGAWLGVPGRLPPLDITLLIIIAAIGARIFGMSLNRILDIKIDSENPRTASRNLPSGTMRVKTAFIIAFTGLATYMAACVILNGWCLTLSWIPIIPLTLYSFLKRFTFLCHFGIGLCLGIAPIGAYVAASGDLNFTAPILFFSCFVFFWMSGADIIYSLMDIESDKKNGIYSIPVKVGHEKSQIVAGLIHFIAVICLLTVLFITKSGIWAYIAAITSIAAFSAMYISRIPVSKRFFPVSTIAGIAGSFVPITAGF